MKRLFIGLCIPIILLGIVAISFHELFDVNVISYAKLEQIPNSKLHWWNYDTWSYLNGLKNSFRTINKITIDLPTRQWQSEGLSSVGNNFAVVIDWLIFIANLLLYPFRLGAYFVQISLQMIGINTLPGYYEENPFKWLIDLSYKLKNMQLKYI